MNFDDVWDWDAEPRSGGGYDGGHTQKVPDGRHTGDIVKVEKKDLKFKQSDDNPSGTCLIVTWSKDATHFPVESIVPQTWRGLIEAICRAAGVAGPQRGEDWDPQSLVGRVATIDVENAVSAKGKEYQRITKWHASPQKPLPPAEKAPPPVKRSPARTPAAKAHAEFKEHADADDIPF
jgi:hypothetical protein